MGGVMLAADFDVHADNDSVKSAQLRHRIDYCKDQRKTAIYNRTEMLTVADQLRTAREAKNLTVYQIADLTKIRTDHIRALDEGNYDVFSAPVYIRGSVRAYA